jgi:hypothetical protein
VILSSLSSLTICPPVSKPFQPIFIHPRINSPLIFFCSAEGSIGARHNVFIIRVLVGPARGLRTSLVLTIVLWGRVQCCLFHPLLHRLLIVYHDINIKYYHARTRKPSTLSVAAKTVQVAVSPTYSVQTGRQISWTKHHTGNIRPRPRRCMPPTGKS